MKETGMVPVFYHHDPTVCQQVVKACYEGGVRVFEFTNRGERAHEVFAAICKWAAIEIPDMIVGVGSVIDSATAALYIQLGANFIVSPLIDEQTAIICNRRKIAWIPGCGSVTEINRAHELGAEVVKLFPGAAVGGPDFITAIKGPMPWASLMPTGGVSPDEQNLVKWFKAGVHCVGIGSQLFPKEDLRNGNFKTIKEKCRLVLNIINSLK